MTHDTLTIGELAKLMGITVRTLQYYDKEGLLKPSCLSEGGRRLYTAEDVIKLHQILSFKYLGFSLEEIKNRLFTLKSPHDVAMALEHQKYAIEEQITKLQHAYQAIVSLHNEVLAIQKVDFLKYAEIIELLKIGNGGYWVWKHFDDPLKTHIRKRFGDNASAALNIFETYKEVLEEALLLKRKGIRPDSKESFEMAEKWWNMILEFTGGNLELIPQLEAFNQSQEASDHDLAEKQKEVDDFISEALGIFLAQHKETHAHE